MSFGDPWFYIVLLGAAALVYAMLLPGRTSNAEPQRKSAGELEATLEQYMSEIERENEELIHLVAQMKQDISSKQLAQQEQIVELRHRLGDVENSARYQLSRLELLEQASASKESQGQATLTEAAPPAGEPMNEANPLVIEEIPVEPSAAAVSEADLEAAAGGTDSVKERYPELFDLYAKGKSLDMIAKTTGIQRGEVQLILQLAKREESR